MNYHITVFDKRTGESVDSTTVPVGKWKEIGYWLDNYGYIDERYIIGIEVK